MTKKNLWPYGMALIVFATSIGLSACSHSPAKTEKTTTENTEATTPAKPIVSVFTLRPQVFQKNQRFPGELLPYEVVDVYPKISGFIQSIAVDRGSRVHQGQLLARLVAPEMAAQITEARSNVQSAVAEQGEARAKYLSDRGLFQRYQEAAKTPGVISENELATAELMAQASQARMQAMKNDMQARQAKVLSLQRIQNYLRITAPIDGVVTQRLLHPGALVGTSGSEPIVRIQQINRLRLLVSIPERYFSSIKTGASIPFAVSAHPGKTFYGIISRPSYTLDAKNRTETVELEVDNAELELSPGMYANVRWPISRPGMTFIVPSSAIVSTTEQTFVNRITPAGKVEWVPVQRGYADGDNVEVFGELHTGDALAVQGSDELRRDMAVTTQQNQLEVKVSTKK